jgi:hypothetical protein
LVLSLGELLPRPLEGVFQKATLWSDIDGQWNFRLNKALTSLLFDLAFPGRNEIINFPMRDSYLAGLYNFGVHRLLIGPIHVE